MKALFFIAVILIVFASCKKLGGGGSSAPQSLLTAHKWYYHVFTQDGQNIELNYCDTNNYLLFSDGSSGGIGNDNAACYGKTGTISTFSYTYSADSNIIHLRDFSGGNYTWQVLTLTNTTLRVIFTVGAPPPAYAPNFDYTYSAR